VKELTVSSNNNNNLKQKVPKRNDSHNIHRNKLNEHDNTIIHKILMKNFSISMNKSTSQNKKTNNTHSKDKENNNSNIHNIQTKKIVNYHITKSNSLNKKNINNTINNNTSITNNNIQTQVNNIKTGKNYVALHNCNFANILKKNIHKETQVNKNKHNNNKDNIVVTHIKKQIPLGRNIFSLNKKQRPLTTNTLLTPFNNKYINVTIHQNGKRNPSQGSNNKTNDKFKEML
jgi:hypothetical protein